MELKDTYKYMTSSDSKERFFAKLQNIYKVKSDIKN